MPGLGAERTDVRLCEADLKSSMLILSNFSAANFQEADLTKATMILTSLAGADLREAKLKEVLFHGINLSNANLSGADLRGAKFLKYKLPNSKNPVRTNLRGVRWNDKTRWPEKDSFQGAENIPSRLRELLK
jgi:uncharacterized protein YjbI with pentapeptide repeats